MCNSKAFGALFGILFLFSACKSEPKSALKTEAITFTKEGELQVFAMPGDSLRTTFAIDIAESVYETLTGVMYRESMRNEEAMLFIFPDVAVHSFYMKNTQFPLDILFIDEGMTIVSMQENTEPYNEAGLSSVEPIKYVLEINGGLSAQLGLAIGDRVSFKRQ